MFKDKKLTFKGCLVIVLVFICLVFMVTLIRVITKNMATKFYQNKKSEQIFPLISKDAHRTILGDTLFFVDKGVKYKVVKMGDSLFAYDSEGRLFCKDSKANVQNCIQNLNIQDTCDSYIKGDTLVFIENGVTYKTVVKNDSAFLYDNNGKFIRKFSLKPFK